VALPIDANRMTLLAMSGARPAPAYAELADGSTRAVPGEQGRNADGVNLWQVDTVMPGDADDERGRMMTATIKIAQRDRPVVTPGMPVKFAELAVTPYVDRQSGRVALSWSAAGIEAPAAVRPVRAASGGE
jgi:hypothetical protein